MLDAFTDPEVETVSVMKSARIGWTKGINIVSCYYMHYDPCPIMIVQPTIEDSEGFSKEEIDPMLRDVPVLAKLFAGIENDQTILQKVFRGGSLTMVGANSPRGFRRVSRKVLLFDEVDGYPASAGKEGDQIKLGKRRTEYYWDRKIGLGSTPTIDGASRIQKSFTDGDQRRYYVPCPHCGHMDFFVFSAGRQKGMHWAPEDSERGHYMEWPKDQPELAYFVCRACEFHIDHKHKREMVEAGEWRARKPFNGHASFHIWAAYSYSPNATWADIASEFAAANKAGVEELKTFVNTVLGETWVERGEAPEWELLYRRREKYAIGVCPLDVLFLTCGVDVQQKSLRYEVVGWGRGKRTWSIDAGVIPGDTADLSSAGPWGKVDELLDRMYRHEGGTEMHIAVLAVDSGYNTSTVYTWGRGKPLNRVIAVKGVESMPVILGTPTKVDIHQHGKRIDRGYQMWPVGTSLAKSELYAWIKLQPPLDPAGDYPPGFCHFPEYGEEYFKQLTAEQLMTVRNRKGRSTSSWEVIPGRENHYLDCRIYARVAAMMVGLDRFQESDWIALEGALGRAPPTPAEPAASESLPAAESSVPRGTSWISRKEGGFLRRNR